jgi:hypothetical protein
MNSVSLSRLILLTGLAVVPNLGAQPTSGSTDTVTDSTGNTVTDTSKAPVTREELYGVIGQVLNVDDFYSRALTFTTPQTNRPLTLGATIQTRYTYIQDQPTPNTFSIPLASLSFSGLLYKDFQEGRNLAYSLGFSSINGGTPAPTDASIAYTFLSTADLGSPSLVVSVGQQKKPFGLEAQSTDEQLPSITSSLYLTAGVPYNFSDLFARDIGIVVRADALPEVDYGYNYRSPLISVAAGFFNGSGANALDNNRDKEWTLRAVLAPPVDYYNLLRGLAVGASFDKSERFLTIPGGATTPAKTFWIYKTNAAGAKTDSAKYTVAAVNANPDSLQADRTRYGVDLSYIRTPVNFTAEAVYATQDSAYWDAGSRSFKDDQRRSWAGSVAFFLNIGEQYLKQYRNQSRADDWWPVTWQPFFRVDGLDPNIDVTGDWQLAVTPGVNVFFARTTKFQLDWSWRKTENRPAANAQYLAQFQYGF